MANYVLVRIRYITRDFVLLPPPQLLQTVSTASKGHEHSLHPETTNQCNGERTLEALHSCLSLVVCLCADRGATVPLPLDPPLTRLNVH